MKTFTDKRTVPFSTGQMFDLIWDVERYPEFLPGWRHSRLLERESGALLVEQELRWGPLRVRFCSRVSGSRPRHIDITATETPFRQLNIRWRFEAAGAGGSIVRLHIDFKLRSPGLDRMMQSIIESRLPGGVSAFEERATLVYSGIHAFSECSRLPDAARYR